MADLLRKFNSFEVKQKKSRTILWVIFAVYVLSVVISVPLAIYSFNRSQKNSQSSISISNLTPTTPPPKPTPTPLYGIIPESYELQGGTHNFQTFNNCGPSSLSMALSFYGIYVSQKVLGDELRPYQISTGDNDDKSVTLSELAEKSKDFGFIPYHRPNGSIDVVKKFIANDVPVITRTLTKINEDIGHFRVVYGYDDRRGQIIQNDSLQGKGLKYDYSEFLELWKPYGFEYLALVKPGQENVVKSIIGENTNEKVAWQNTVQQLEESVSNNPNDIYLNLSLAVAYYEVGDYSRSIEVFESIESQLPFRTLWYQIEPLLAYQKLGRYDELIPRIDNILNNGNRAFSELYQIKGEIYLDGGNVEAARSEFATAVYYNKNFEPAKAALRTLDDTQ